MNYTRTTAPTPITGWTHVPDHDNYYNQSSMMKVLGYTLSQARKLQHAMNKADYAYTFLAPWRNARRFQTINYYHASRISEAAQDLGIAPKNPPTQAMTQQTVDLELASKRDVVHACKIGRWVYSRAKSTLTLASPTYSYEIDLSRNVHKDEWLDQLSENRNVTETDHRMLRYAFIKIGYFGRYSDWFKNRLAAQDVSPGEERDWSAH